MSSCKMTRIEKVRLSFLLALCTLVCFLIFGINAWLETTAPETRKSHKNLLTLVPDSDLQEYAAKRIPQLNTKFFYVVGHGAGDTKGIWGVEDKRSNLKHLSADELAKTIRNEQARRGVASNTPIYLLACNAGAGTKPFAQELSDILGVRVIAPTEWLIIDNFGNIRTGWYEYLAFFSYGRSKFKVFSPA